MGRRFALSLLVALSIVLVLRPAMAVEQPGDPKGRTALVGSSNSHAALSLFQQALDRAEARYGPDDPRLAANYSNLGRIHRALGRLDMAERMFRQAIRLNLQPAGNGRDLAANLSDLALVYRAQRQMNKAEDAYSQALAVLERTLGPDHPDIARTLNELALLHLDEQRPDEALPLQKRAVRVAEASLGAKHPTTLTLRANLRSIEKRSRDVPGASAPVTQAAPPAAPPAATTAERATTRPMQAPRFGIFLNSIRDADEAPAAWAKLVERFPSLAELPLQPPRRVEIPGGAPVYRVVGGDFSDRAAAERACMPIRKARIFCGVSTL